MSKPKVFLTGGEETGWAVDEDLKLARTALTDLVELVDLSECEVVHACWWWGLMAHPPERLDGKRIVCHVPGEPFRYFAVPEHRRVIPVVGRWITRTSQAARQMKSLGFSSTVIPYLVDTDTFKPVAPDDSRLETVREQWDLPTGPYLIGSFQRDTEGADLRSPKLVKGPDIFLEILRGLRRRSLDFHVVLAGPRRGWLIHRLQEEGIPFTYIGKRLGGDDLAVNTLPRSELNLLYNLVDLYVVASRSEGGPHAILEAAAARCAVISTPVGMAPDFLDPGAVFRHPAEAMELIGRDVDAHVLDSTRDLNYERVVRSHRPESVRPLFAEFYEAIDTAPVFKARRASPGRPGSTDAAAAVGPPAVKRAADGKMTVGLWHTFFKPPYGGGNQFMMALRKGLLTLGADVRDNELSDAVDAYVLNSIHFDVDAFLSFSRAHRLKVIHRIDGPIHLIRGFDREKDELCYRLNDQFAAATVLQSAWVYQRIVDMGYQPVSPTIIHNAVDSEIFHPRGRIPFDPQRKVRLISTSWSNNPRKGGPTYKWIEERLDWDRFEYTYVGNASESFDRIRHIPPVPSEDLADLLRNHDVYITASKNDPCSNALIEALACGLPALYLNDGGHPELVGSGGLGFTEEDEILPTLDQLVESYESFQRLITVSRMEDVAAKYLALVRDVIQ